MGPLPEIFSDKARIVCEYAAILWHKSFVDGNGGNVSMRVSSNTVLCTPTLFSKSRLKEKDICLVNLNGEQISGIQKPSSEITTHLAVYKADPTANMVIHCHPPYTCSYAFTERLPYPCLSPEAALWMDEIVMLPFYIPGSKELAEAIEYNAQDRHSLILQNHGLITWGKTPEEAYWRTEVIESHCRISHLIEARNSKPRHFTSEEYAELMKVKDKMLNGSK